MENKKIEIEVPEGKVAKWVNGVLTLVDEVSVDNRPVTERIKNLDDAIRELGDRHPFVEAFNGYTAAISPDVAEDIDILAYLKLRIIVAALNEGWEPKFTEDEWRYYPWFYLYTEREIKDMSSEEREKRRMMSTDGYVTDFAGFGFATTNIVPSSTTARIGSRLCLKNSDLATYCGKQFIDIWADFYLIKS